MKINKYNKCNKYNKPKTPTNTGADDSVVVVRIDADVVLLEVEGKLAVLDLLQLVLVQIGPPPDFGVKYVWKELPPGNL